MPITEGPFAPARKQMRRAKEALLLRDPAGSLADIIATDRSAFSGMRIMFASDVAGVTLDELFGTLETIPLAQLFCGKGLLAYSDQIAQQMRTGVAPLRFASRTLMDTNFLSELPKLCGGEDFKGRERLDEILGLIDARCGRTLEWTFACLENMREALKSNNPWPYRKVAAAKFLSEAPEDFRTQIGRTSMLEKYIPEAEEMWRAWISSPYTWHTLDRRDLLYCVLLRAMLECWTGSTVTAGLGRLVDYCLDSFGILPLKESEALSKMSPVVLARTSPRQRPC